MAITHSPTPWGYPSHTGHGRFEVSNNQRIAVCDRFDDACLIQSAPDMLKALRMVVSWWLEQGMHGDSIGAPACVFEARRVLAQLEEANGRVASR